MQGRPVLYALIAVNVAVHLAWLMARDSEPALDFMAANFLVSVDHLAAGHVWTPFTAAISHMDTNHLLFNMLALWVFGRDTADVLGPWRFLHLYVAGGIVSSLAYVCFQLVTGVDAPSLGASGAIMALAVVYAALFPTRRLLVLGLVPASAPIVVIGYTLIDLLGVVSRFSDGVAHAAHLGGAAYGFVYWLILRRTVVRE
jgi:rhomboid-like protein